MTRRYPAPPSPDDTQLIQAIQNDAAPADLGTLNAQQTTQADAAFARAEALDARVNEAVAPNIASGSAQTNAATRQNWRINQAQRERNVGRIDSAVVRQQARNASFAFYMLIGILTTTLLVGAIWFFNRPQNTQTAAASTGRATSAVIAPTPGAIYNSTGPSVPNETAPRSNARAFVPPPGPPTLRARQLSARPANNADTQNSTSTTSHNDGTPRGYVESGK